MQERRSVAGETPLARGTGRTLVEGLSVGGGSPSPGTCQKVALLQEPRWSCTEKLPEAGLSPQKTSVEQAALSVKTKESDESWCTNVCSHRFCPFILVPA